MATDQVTQLVADCVQPISGLLYQDTAVALINAENRVGDLVKRGHLHLRSLTVRAEVRAQLEDQELGDWLVSGNPSLMGELYLSHPEAAITLRMLKERRRTYPGGVPVAGHNRARRDYWQSTLPAEFPAVPSSEADIQLLLLWDLLDANDLDKGFALRVVHTTAPGEYGRHVPVDLSIDLDATGGSWASFEFMGGDEDEDFFVVEVDEAAYIGVQEAM